MKNTTETGYINQHNQRNNGLKGISDTHYNQRFFEMECLNCGHKYFANGCDIWLRKCPNCQSEKSHKNKKQSNSFSHRSRSISVNLRYQVLKRDNFKCCACGASPAKDPAVELHVDHIIPWANGGETVLENLQTLCAACNIGKGSTF